jgi:hypothetical protein
VDTCFAFLVAQWLLSSKNGCRWEKGWVTLGSRPSTISTPGRGQPVGYAAPCVSGEIKRHFPDKRWQIHVRRLLQDLLLEIRAVSGKLAQERGHAPLTVSWPPFGSHEDGIREAR